jgi:hypothetical protein
MGAGDAMAFDIEAVVAWGRIVVARAKRVPAATVVAIAFCIVAAVASLPQFERRTSASYAGSPEGYRAP